MPKKKQIKNLTLGELQKVYRVKLGCGQLFTFGFVLFPLLFFMIPMFVLNAYILLIFVIPLSIAFYAGLRVYLEERHDEMRVYENGFTYYKIHKGLQTCFWSEIDYFIRARWSRIAGVRKKNGEEIYWSDEIPGIDDLTADGRDKLMQF